MKKNKEMKFIMRDKKIMTRRDLFKSKEAFHKHQAQLPFGEKIKILVELQKIAAAANPAKGKKIVWKI